MGIGPNDILSKDWKAEAAVTIYRILKRGAADDQVVHAAAAIDKLIGVAQHAAAINERVRAMHVGISKVEYGGTITQGDLLTADANGKAIAVTRHTHTENTAATYTQNATTVAGSGERVIGVAMVSGVANDIGLVLLSPAFA